MHRQYALCLLTLLAPLGLPAGGSCGELAILSPKTWDDFVPKGKEVDAIYGDFVLRNDRIVAVIANPVRGRNANMTVKEVGGSIIDLTVRGNPNDQLSAYYPGARRFPYQLDSVLAKGHVSAEPRGAAEGDSMVLRVTDGKLSPTVEIVRGDTVQLSLMAPATEDRPMVRLTYTLQNGWPAVEIRSEFFNSGSTAIPLTLVDDFRADRTFTTASPGPAPLVWFYDRSWGQAYAVLSSSLPMRLSGSPADPRVIEFLKDSSPTVQLAPGNSIQLTRSVVPGPDLVSVKAAAARITNANPDLTIHQIELKDSAGRGIADADLLINAGGELYGNARTGSDGTASLELPSGTYQCTISALARGSKDFTIEPAGRGGNGGGNGANRITLQLPAAPQVVAEISDADGKPIPCKVQFIGVDGTPSPNFFDETGEFAVRNLVYSPSGRFTQLVPPGTYEVVISYGPEFDVEKAKITTRAGENTPVRATLRRVVNSPGWISADFHGHSSPSGDNVSSQLGRVLNLLCEHIEFAPCTEHNRLDSYVPHLKSLGVENRMGTCTGVELTGLPGTINHQNAFPMVMKPRTQNNGGPEPDADPEVQIKRLALWDGGSDKLVQSNHPDMGEMFFDKKGTGTPDGGYRGMFAYQDVIEVHPIHDVLAFSPLRYNTVEDRVTKLKTTNQYNNSIFNWVQLINQGKRLPGVVNTDAHYNFHGSGYIRNYVKCSTDEPSKIDPMEIVHSAEKGHIILTNGPYLEVELAHRVSSGATNEHAAIAGDDLDLPDGLGSLHIRVQCPNWFDIDRVQVLRNGRPDPSLNWTRAANPDFFSGSVTKFDRTIPIEFATDTHVMVIAAGESTQIGTVMGPEWGKHKPTAISNPIFVDVDGGGFKANGDTLGHPLPVKEQRPVP